jgi:hypothetical protein
VTAYDLSGRVSLQVSGSSQPVAAAVARLLDPFTADPLTGQPDVRLEFGGDLPAPAVDVQHPARDGTTTSYDGRALSLLSGRTACAVLPSPGGGWGSTLCPDPGFPLGPLFRRLVRPALQAAMRPGAVAVHSASVELDGRALVIAGWSESGKTETALALMEQGASWLTDKWTIVGADGTASGFPVNVGVRRWVLPYLPQLAAALPRAPRAQVALAGAAAVASGPLRHRGQRGGAVRAAAAAAERVVGLLDRAALTQSEIRVAYGQDDDPARRVPVGTVVLLTTVPGSDVSVGEVRPDRAAARLALTGAYERYDWYQLQDRQRYAQAAAGEDPRQRDIEAERRILEPVLAGVRLLHVRAPFPADPTRVVRAIREAL